MNLRLVTILATAVTLLAAAAPSPAHAGAAFDAGFAELPSLWEHRTGVSEPEPDFCPSTETREQNPSAANAGSIEAGPPKFLVEGLEPGRSYRHCFFILNRQAQPRTFRLSTLDVGGSLDPDVTLETRDTPAVVGRWIHLPITTVDLEPGERVIVPYRLDVPEQPPVGTSVGGIRIADASRTESGAGAAVRKSLVLQLQVTFPGGASEALEVSDIEATRLIWRGRDPARYELDYVVANRGTVVDTVRPTLRVDGLFGRRYASVSGVPDVVVPGSAQRGSITWNDPPWVGRYTPVLEVRTNEGTQRIDLPTLWVIPPWPYLVALAAAALLFAWAIWRRRSGSDWREYLDEDDEERPYG